MFKRIVSVVLSWPVKVLKIILGVQVSVLFSAVDKSLLQTV